jgi:hypothetical protein
VGFLPKTPEQNNWAQNEVSLSSADTRTLRTNYREERYMLFIFVCCYSHVVGARRPSMVSPYFQRPTTTYESDIINCSRQDFCSSWPSSMANLQASMSLHLYRPRLYYQFSLKIPS